MILICTNLQKFYLVSLFDLQTDFLQLSVYSFIEHNTPVFGRKNQMIDQDCYIMTLMNIFTHITNLIIFSKQSFGELTPVEIRQTLSDEIWDEYD